MLQQIKKTNYNKFFFSIDLFDKPWHILQGNSAKTRNAKQLFASERQRENVVLIQKASFSFIEANYRMDFWVVKNSPQSNSVRLQST